MGAFHDFDVNIESRIGRSVVQRHDAIHSLDRFDQGQQFGLAPDDDLAREPTQRRQKPGKLDGVAKAMIATHKDTPALQGLATPNALEVARAFVLASTGAADQGNVVIADVPGAREVTGAHRSDPVAETGAGDILNATSDRQIYESG